MTPAQYDACRVLDRSKPNGMFTTVPKGHNRTIISKMPDSLIEKRKIGKTVQYRLTEWGLSEWIKHHDNK